MAAWWTAMEPFIADMRSLLVKHSAFADEFSERQSLKPVTVSQIAALFGVDESIGTAVYTTLEGETKGLLMLSSNLPATTAIEVASEVFRAFARGVGGQFEESWALMDMRSTLAESLAAQTGSLELGAAITIEWPSTIFCFIPDWARWSARTHMELREEAA